MKKIIFALFAIAAISSCKDSKKTETTPPKKVEGLTQAKDYLLLNQKDSALFILNKLLAASPTNVAAATIQSQLLFEKNNTKEALQTLNNVLAKDSNNMEILFMKSAMQIATKDTQNVQAQLAKVSKYFSDKLNSEPEHSRNKKSYSINNAMAQQLLGNVQPMQTLAKNYKNDGFIQSIAKQDKAALINQILMRK